MSLQNLTIKSQERIQHAQQLAFNNGNTSIETEHLLQSLLDDTDSAIEFLLKKNNVNINFVETKLADSIKKLAKVSGTDPAQNMSRDLNNVLLRSSAALKQFGDEFVAPEHLLIALLEGKDNTAKILKDAGLTEKGLIAATKELKKGSTVT